MFLDEGNEPFEPEFWSQFEKPTFALESHFSPLELAIFLVYLDLEARWVAIYLLFTSFVLNN